MRHDGLAAGGHLADSLAVGVQNPQLDTWQRLTHGVSPKRSQIVQGKRSSALGKPVSVYHWNTQVVKELHGRRLHEGSTGDERFQCAAKGLVYLRQKSAAQFHSRSSFREQLVDTYDPVQQEPFGPRQFVELGFEPALQVLEHHGYEADVGDLVLGKCVADVLGA